MKKALLAEGGPAGRFAVGGLTGVTLTLDRSDEARAAGVDAVGIRLQSDARHAGPKLIESDYLADTARAVFQAVGASAPVQSWAA